ncbi:MAG: DUF1071 domain-containing protein [Aristaeellaceae bacterium]
MSIFERLNAINVNGHTETKGTGSRALTYLSWAWAWAEVKKAYPDSYYTIYEGKDGCLYHTDGRTCWVKTGVTVVDREGGTQLEHIEYLPVMDNRNESIRLEKVTSYDVNKAIQRSLTKACARHGLGLYIYAGEDLPEAEAEESAKPVTPPAYDPAKKLAEIKLRFGVDNAGFARMRQALIDGKAVPDKPSSEMTESDWKQLFTAIEQNFGDAA